MPPTKKKLSKKEKARLEAEQAELLRLELEKERLRKLEEARQRRKLELEQTKRKFKTEIADYKHRRRQLRDSTDFLLDFQHRIEAIKCNELEEKEWSKYMRCNGLPDTDCPGDLRTYMHQWHHDVTERNRLSRNWLIEADESTLLTQDCNVKNLTAISLRQQQSNLGDLYSERVKEVLGILGELECSLLDKRKSWHILIDLKELRTEIRLFLMDYIDDFTYKITSHVERDMHLERPGVFKHVYDSEVFKNFIWTFSKDAQLTSINKPRIGEPEEPTELQFSNIKVNIVLPSTVKLLNSTLRGLWLNTDLISDYCSSFYLHKELQATNINLLQQTFSEWRKRKQILQEILDNCNREISDTELESFQQGKELSELPPLMEPDIDKLYMEYDNEMNKIKKESMSPESYGLRATDINLRKYRIIGGLYSIYYLETPEQDKQLNKHTFIRTMNQPSKLHHKIYHENFVPPPPPQPGVRRLPEEIEAEIRMVEKALDKLILITVQLPDSILWFEPPLACRWETEIETIESDNKITLENALRSKCDSTRENNKDDLSDSLSESIDFDINHITKSSTSIDSSADLSDEYWTIDNFRASAVTLEEKFYDFDILKPPHDIDLINMIEKFVVPRLPDGLHWCIPPTNKSYIKSRQKTQYIIPIARLSNLEIKNIPNKQKWHKNPKRLQNFIKNTANLHRLEPGEIFPAHNFGQIEAIDKNNFDQDFTFYNYKFSQLLKDLEGLSELEKPQDPTKLFQQIGILQKNVNNQVLNIIKENQHQPKQNNVNNNNIMMTTDNVRNELTDSTIDDTLLSKLIDIEDNLEKCDPYSFNDSDSCKSTENNMDKEKIDPQPQPQLESNEKIDKQPIIVKGKWTGRDIHDTKFNEDKLSIQFRTGRLGIFGFALNRYSNMPYQTWELKPLPKTCSDAVIFNFTAALISLDIEVSQNGYCITNFQGGTTSNITSMIGQILPLETIKKKLISSAVDIFPEEDAFCYTEGSCEKNYVMEMHLYACMSSMVLSHNFNWSRWNLLAGSRKAVLLMRELVEGTKMANYSTLLVTPLKTAIIDCTEVSASFNTRSIEGMQFYADLYQLAKVHSHASSWQKQINLDPMLRNNVATLLMAIRPLSFC